MRHERSLLLAVLALVAGALLPVGAAQAQAGPAFPSDDFDRAELGAPWVVTDPAGAGSVAVAGAGSGDARLQLTVPDGTSYEPWNTNNRALRAMRPAADTDFQAVVRFDSTPAQRYQLQGLMVHADADDWLRFEVHHNGTGLRAFAGTTANGASTKRLDKPAAGAAYLRVTRAGDAWTLATSANGTSWSTAGTFTFATDVTQVGVFAGNAGSPQPGFTASVDYLFEASAPIEDEDGGGTTPTSTTTTAPTTTTTAGPTTTTTGPTTTSTSTTTTAPTTTTTAPPAGTTFTSDDFNRTTLAPRPWTVVDHVGDGSVTLAGAGTQNARLNLAVPGGVKHDAWNTNGGLRVLQPTGDGDFTAELKFDSVPNQKFQTQGFLVQQDADDWARFDVFWNGSALRGYAATTVGGTTTKRIEKTVTAGTSVWVRVDRDGDTWTLTTSANGTAWTTVGSFTHALDVTATGPYAGNSGTPVPAFTALVDYVFETASPVVPEDTAVPDTTPPVIANVAVAPGSSSATVSWTTDEPASSTVRVGTTSAYTHGTFGSPSPTTNHSVQVTGLTPGATYHYQVASADGGGLTSTTGDATFTTSLASGPVIDVWGGASQAFATRGTPQARANVNGNVGDPDGVTSLTYSLNGGPARNLTIGPNNRRLQAAGDFNADIPFTDLAAGANTVRFTARDGAGNTTTRDVTVTKNAGGAPLPFQTNWGSAARISDHAQVVDGKWRLEGNGLRIDRMGYDRIVAVGDTSWHDYEMTVPVTVHGLGPGNGSYLSGNSLVGFGLNWQGHQQVGNEQPGYMWYPTGALGWYRWYDSGPKFELFGNDNSPVKRHTRSQLQFGQTYMFKARSDTVAGGVQYSWKVWPQGQAEPAAWDLTLLEDDGPETGSLILIAHHADVVFGNVSVSSIP